MSIFDVAIMEEMKKKDLIQILLEQSELFKATEGLEMFAYEEADIEALTIPQLKVNILQHRAIAKRRTGVSANIDGGKAAEPRDQGEVGGLRSEEVVSIIEAAAMTAKVQSDLKPKLHIMKDTSPKEIFKAYPGLMQYYEAGGKCHPLHLMTVDAARGYGARMEKVQSELLEIVPKEFLELLFAIQASKSPNPVRDVFIAGMEMKQGPFNARATTAAVDRVIRIRELTPGGMSYPVKEVIALFIRAYRPAEDQERLLEFLGGSREMLTDKISVFIIQMEDWIGKERHRHGAGTGGADITAGSLMGTAYSAGYKAGKGAQQYNLYCWKHGWGTHTGATCKWTTMTEAQKKARSPTEVPGGSTFVKVPR